MLTPQVLDPKLNNIPVRISHLKPVHSNNRQPVYNHPIDLNHLLYTQLKQMLLPPVFQFIRYVNHTADT